HAEPTARFEVAPPPAIAGVRGTSFLASYDPSQEETLVVGLLDVTRVRSVVDTQGTAEVNLGPGFATRVRRGSRPLAPALIPEEQLRSLRSATELRGRVGRGSNRLDPPRPQRPG